MNRKIAYEDDGMCFACGKKNPIGLKLDPKLDSENRLVAKFTPGMEYQGFKGILHGGIVATLLDEVMVNLVLMLGRMAVTSSFSVKLHKPILVGEELTITGELVRDRGRILETKAEIRAKDGTLLASGEGVCVRMRQEKPAGFTKFVGG